MTEPLIEMNIAETLGISAYENKMMRECSLGMQKRLVLALALQKNLPILILDEPFIGIDVDTLLLIKVLLKKLLETSLKKMILIASHQLDLLQELCDFIVVLHEGRVVESGTPQKLLEKTQKHSLFSAYQSLI